MEKYSKDPRFLVFYGIDSIKNDWRGKDLMNEVSRRGTKYFVVYLNWTHYNQMA